MEDTHSCEKCFSLGGGCRTKPIFFFIMPHTYPSILGSSQGSDDACVRSNPPATGPCVGIKFVAFCCTWLPQQPEIFPTLLLYQQVVPSQMALVSTEMQLRSMSPGPERFMTMNLMSSGPCTVSKDATSYGRTVRRMNTRDNHTTADVDGARTFVRTSTLTNKPDSYGVAVRRKHTKIKEEKACSWKCC